MSVEVGVVSSPEGEESGWVPLQNTFSQNLSRRGEQEEFSFTIAKGTTDSQLQVSFSGSVEGGEVCELCEEMSFDKLLTLHRQLVELYPDDVHEDMLPQLPSVPQGIWSSLFSVEIRDELYDELKQYLTNVASSCSVENVLAVFFADAFCSPVDYEEKWSDLNKKHYLDEREAMLKERDRLLTQRGQTEFRNMQQLHDYYDEEDDMEYHLEKAEEKLHYFQVKPFKDLCEITQRRRNELSQRAKDVGLPVAEQVKALHEEREVHEQYLEASESLHELMIEKSHMRAERVECMLRRVYEDKQHLGKSWDKRAQNRIDRIENRLNKIIVDMLRTQCRRLADQKDRALLDMAIVEEGPEMEAEVREKEDMVYQIQLRLYEINLRLLEEDERRLKLQERFADGEDLVSIQRRLEHIPSKMSKIRLKMQTCKKQLVHPGKRTINVEESYAAQFAAQTKEVVAKREEEKRKQLMKEQRQKTILRVKQYMEKNPVPVKKLPPRYQRPSQRQDTRRKPPEKKPSPHGHPMPSRVSATTPLTKGVYTKKTSDHKTKTTGQNKPNTEQARKGTKQQKSDKVPNSAMHETMQALAETAKTLPPPPPPAPLPPAPPPPPPPIQLEPPTPKPRKLPEKKSAPTKRNGSAHGGIDLSAIINARQRLKPSEFGKALGEGGLTDTSAEVACLIRSGAKAETASLTKDNASYLRRRIKYIEEVTHLSDSENDSDPEDWDSI